MTRKHTPSVPLLLVFLLLLLAASCSDDTDPPAGKDGGHDGPPATLDTNIPPKNDQAVLPPGKDSTADKSTIPTTINAHMEEACADGLYSINAGKVESTCANVLTMGIDVLQVTFGDNESKPPPAGRTYTVKDPSQVNIYPADGEAIAVYIATAGSQNATSGTFTVDPYTQGASDFSGSYSVTLGNGQQVNGTYLSDFCPFDISNCN